MEAGCIAEKGTYRQLMDNKAAFYNLISTYVGEEESDSDDEAEGEGEAAVLSEFTAAVAEQAPALARIDAVATEPLAPRGERAFRIEPSALEPQNR